MRSALRLGRAASAPSLRSGLRGELLAQRLGDEARGALHGLQCHVAREAVGDHDVDLVREDIVSLDKSDVVEAARRQQVVRGLYVLVALHLFLADVEQADARPLVGTLEIGGEDGSHHPELAQLFRRARGVGAQIEHVGVAAARGNQRDDCRALHAREHLQHEMRHGHQCARIAGADTGIRLVRLDQIESTPHGRVLFAAQCLARVVGHLHHLGGEQTSDIRTAAQADRRQFSLQIGLPADQGEADLRMFERGGQGSRDADGGPSIATHGVDSYVKQRRHDAAKQPRRRISPPGESGLFFAVARCQVRLGLQHLASPIKSVTRDAVPRMGFAALRIDGNRRKRQRGMRAVHAAFRRSFSAFLNCHECYVLSSFLQ